MEGRVLEPAVGGPRRDGLVKRCKANMRPLPVGSEARQQTGCFIAAKKNPTTSRGEEEEEQDEEEEEGGGGGGGV